MYFSLPSGREIFSKLTICSKNTPEMMEVNIGLSDRHDKAEKKLSLSRTKLSDVERQLDRLG